VTAPLNLNLNLNLRFACHQSILNSSLGAYESSIKPVVLQKTEIPVTSHG
jgi:hypothetical protein